MLIKRWFYFSIVSLSATLLLYCKQEPPVVNRLNEAVAGVYAGQYECVSYNGTMYSTHVDSGTLEIAALGIDSLRVSHSNGCVFDTYVYQYDSLDTNTYGYTRWTGNGPYVGVYHFAVNDSIVVATPQHFSIGWLGKSFYGKKQ